jgi:hypothetical protein
VPVAAALLVGLQIPKQSVLYFAKFAQIVA